MTIPGMSSLLMTGNTVVDSLIVMHVIPIMSNYVTYVMNMISVIGWMIAGYINRYMQYYVRNYTVGSELITVKVDDKNFLFPGLESLIMDVTVKSETYDVTCLGDLFRVDIKDTANVYTPSFKYEQEWVDLDPATVTTISLTKVFKYEDYMVRVVYNGADSINIPNRELYKNLPKSEIMLTLVGKRKKGMTDDDYRGIIKKFISERVTRGKYIYHIRIFDKPLQQILSSISEKSSGKYPFFLDTSYNKKQNAKNLEKAIQEEATVAEKLAQRELGLYLSTQNLGDKTANYTDEFKIVESRSLKNYEQKTFDYYFKQCDQTLPISQSNSQFYYDCRIGGNDVVFVYYFLMTHGSLGYYMLTVLSDDAVTQTKLREYVNSLIKLYNNSIATAEKKAVKIYKRKQNAWDKYTAETRCFDNVYLSQNTMLNIRREIEDFKDTEEVYKEFELPYRKGMLFYGPPGTGKSTIIKSIAYEYQFPIYLVDVNAENNESLTEILNSLGNEGGIKLLVFEDIDTAFADTENGVNVPHMVTIQSPTVTNAMTTCESAGSPDEFTSLNTPPQPGMDMMVLTQTMMQPPAQPGRRNRLTYSDLLNAFDGVINNHRGVITIMTTNHIEKLGDAFLRPGRIDCKFELKECDAWQVEQMVRGYINKAIKISPKLYTEWTKDRIDTAVTDLMKKLSDAEGNLMYKIRPCYLQNYLLKYIRRFEGMFEDWQDLTKDKFISQ